MTGIQIIYKAINGNLSLNPSLGKCRICGGDLTVEHYNHKNTSSGKWTDESIARCKNSDNICAACNWFREGTNRRAYWNASSAFIADENGIVYNKDFADFYNQIVNKKISGPTVFMCRGDNPNLTQKHVQWRSIEGVTTSREKIKLVYNGLRIFRNSSEVSGVAEFSAKDIKVTVENLCQEIKMYLEPTTKYMKTDWQKRNYYIKELWKAYEKQLTPSLMIAFYFAAAILTSEEEK